MKPDHRSILSGIMVIGEGAQAFMGVAVERGILYHFILC